jgi:nitrate reductase delta subunit
LFAQRTDGVAKTFRPFLEGVRDMSLEDAQELYTRTFDINPVCTLEVGWHVYGEDYARGEFLVKMRQQLREYNLSESKELPDHITHVLALLCHLPKQEADDLAARYVLPALGKMRQGLSDAANPSQALIEAILESVRSNHNVQEITPRQPRGDPPGWASPLPVCGPGAPGGGKNGAR